MQTANCKCCDNLLKVYIVAECCDPDILVFFCFCVSADFSQALILEPTNKTASEALKRLKKLI